MKKILLLFFLLVLCVSYKISAQETNCSASVCCNIDGQWSEWEEFGFSLYGPSYGQICDYTYCGHPANFMWRFTISNYSNPTKDLIKYHYKNNLWWEYQGTFEYYITDELPNIRAIFLKTYSQYSHTWSWVNPTEHDISKGQTPCKKKTVKATIKIAPYKDHPHVYNIWFEGYGFGLQI